MVSRGPTNYKYNTNKEVRRKIDKILQECVSMFANIGTKTPYDVGTKEEAKRIECEMLLKIKDLDEQFYNNKLFLKSE